jgi:hypothetical protein
MAATTTVDYGALSDLQKLIGFVMSLVTSIFVSWVRKDKSGVASVYVAQAQKISIIATSVFLIIIWGFWANSEHLKELSVAAALGIASCFAVYLAHVWIVEQSKARPPKNRLVIAFIASYVVYTFAGSLGLSAAGLFATVVLHNPANVSATTKSDSYLVRATLQGTRDVAENQLVPFRASSGQVNVGCEQTAQATVRWTLPPGAHVQGPVVPRWEATDNVGGLGAPPAATISSDTVSAEGWIRGLNQQRFPLGISNCPGGGHGQLVIEGQYIAQVTHSAEVPPVDLGGELNSKNRTIELTIPSGPDFHITNCKVKLLDAVSKQEIDDSVLNLSQPLANQVQESSKGKFTVQLLGQTLRVAETNSLETPRQN